jgi:hypothetical protein
VFKDKLPNTWQSRNVVNGDKHDLRFLDGQKGSIVGLKYKQTKGKPKTGEFINAV